LLDAKGIKAKNQDHQTGVQNHFHGHTGFSFIEKVSKIEKTNRNNVIT
jgi:hypothetical protein